MLKKCYKCKIDQDIANFAINRSKKDGLNAQCRVCQSVLRKDHYLRNKKKIYTQIKEYQSSIRKYIQEYKANTPCKDCNQKYPYYVMDFDHLRDKKFQISVAHNKGFLVLQEEISKCELVCANCHRIRTHRHRSLQV